jgi:transcription initiation factor IIE alpha subunit
MKNVFSVNKYIQEVEIKNKAVYNFGELFLKVAPYLDEPVSAEFISQEIKMKPSRVRAVLNKLFNHNLIEYRRCFDDATGKYTYIWELDKPKFKKFLMNYTFQVEEEEEISDEEYVFVCGSCKEAYTFESAVDCSFICHKCNETIESNE